MTGGRQYYFLQAYAAQRNTMTSPCLKGFSSAKATIGCRRVAILLLKASKLINIYVFDFHQDFAVDSLHLLRTVEMSQA